MFRTSNPAFRESMLDRVRDRIDATPMTLSGTIGKTAILTIAVILSAGYSWFALRSGAAASLSGLLLAGTLGGFVVALLTIFKPTLSPYTGPLYAVLEGVCLGRV